MGTLASSSYWSSRSYSWPSGTGPKIRRSEAVNNSAALEMIKVDKSVKLLVEWVFGKEGTHRPTTNMHRRSLDDYNHTFEWCRACFHS
jgi:hypothetical protein